MSLNFGSCPSSPSFYLPSWLKAYVSISDFDCPNLVSSALSPLFLMILKARKGSMQITNGFFINVFPESGRIYLRTKKYYKTLERLGSGSHLWRKSVPFEPKKFLIWYGDKIFHPKRNRVFFIKSKNMKFEDKKWDKKSLEEGFNRQNLGSLLRVNFQIHVFLYIRTKYIRT